MWSIIIFFTCIAFIVSEDVSKIDEYMRVAYIVPEIIPLSPKKALTIHYNSGVYVKFGNHLTPTQVKDEPIVTWQAEPDHYYTLIMGDPDTHTTKERKPVVWQHWLVGNIPGDSVNKGETISEYIGAKPPPDTGIHRYVFLVFKQQQKLQFVEPRITNKSGKKRDRFSIINFALRYNLGDPVAGNFFHAEFDDYVSVIYDQLDESKEKYLYT